MRYHLSAGGIVYKKNNDGSFVWLVTQSARYRGWIFPKGTVGDNNKDEKIRDAAIRETKEEGGVFAKIVYPKSFMCRYSYIENGEKVKKTVHYFLMEYVSGDPKDHDREVLKADFLSEKNVMKTLMFENDKKLFQKILTYLQKK